MASRDISRQIATKQGRKIEQEAEIEEEAMENLENLKNFKVDLIDSKNNKVYKEHGEIYERKVRFIKGQKRRDGE